jgi:sec-independent protein translocase protein TatA
MGGLGMRELVVILLVVLVVFGAKKLRTVGSDLGHAVRGFKKAMNEGEEEQDAPKQLRAESQDAQFAETPKSEARNDRSA